MKESIVICFFIVPWPIDLASSDMGFQPPKALANVCDLMGNWIKTFPMVRERLYCVDVLLFVGLFGELGIELVLIKKIMMILLHWYIDSVIILTR